MLKNPVLYGTISILILSLGFFSPAQAQRSTQKEIRIENTTVRDVSELAGYWRIEVIDRPDDTFKGEATIPRGSGDQVVIELIAEDQCCGGNHARALQRSTLTVEGQDIYVESEIVEFLLKIEATSAQYYADDFELRRVSKDVLEGRANGFTRVRWIRGEPEIS